MTLVEVFTARAESEPAVTHTAKTKERGVVHLNTKGGAAEAIALLTQTHEREKSQTDEQSRILESPFLHPESDTPIFTRTISCFLIGVNFFGPGYIAGTEGLEIYIGADDFAMPSVTQDTGFLLTGSRDCGLRFWELNDIGKSRVICGGNIGDEKPSFRTEEQSDSVKVHSEVWGGHRFEKRLLSRSNLLASHQQEMLKAHQDSIVAIACIQYPFRGGIITADASGGLKVWRVETT